MADTTPGNTTVGVELEFVFLCPQDVCRAIAKKHDWVLLDHAARYMIHQALQAVYETPCWVEGCHGSHRRHLPVAPFDRDLAEDSDSEDTNMSDDSDSPVSSPYSGWIVSRDLSVSLSPEETATISTSTTPLDDDDFGFHITPIEIQSRIMNANKPTTCPGHREYHDEAYNYRFEVEHVIQLLNTQFNNPQRPGYRMITNSSSGLHVHVGGQEPQDRAHTARGVMAMNTAFERAIDEVLTIPRISGYMSDPYDDRRADPVLIQGVDEGKAYDYPGSNEVGLLEQSGHGHFCRSLSFIHIEGIGSATFHRRMNRDRASTFKTREEAIDPVFYAAETRLHVPAWLYIMMTTKSVMDLSDLWCMSMGHMTNINLDNIRENLEDGGQKWTIEYRAHAGTLDVMEIVCWMDWTTKLTDYCSRISSVSLTEYIHSCWADPDFTFLQLLEDVGCQQETQEFYQRMFTDKYAAERRDAVMEHESRYPDTDILKQLVEVSENAKYEKKLHRHVQEKITRKLHKGLYGKFPKDNVAMLLSPEIAKHQGHRLTMKNTDGISEMQSTDPNDEFETEIGRTIEKHAR